jgi:UDP-glucose 4-epimerase
MNRILLTGASGFVGAHVARLLVEQGRTVAVLLRPTSDTRRLAPVLDRLTLIRGDLFRLGACEAAVRDFAPQGIAHLAWDGVKGADRNGPMQAGNIAASIALYQLFEILDCAAFVGLGSQAEYGPAPGKLDESGPTRPTTVYGAAKLATGMVLERMAAAAGRRLAWLRLFSSYGDDDDPSWMLQYLSRSLLAGERPSVTAAEQRWDYIHVDDVASAVVAALDSRAHGVFNLGSGDARPLRHIIEQLRDLIDPALPVGFGEVPYRPDQVMHLEADIAALRAATGWQPRVTLEDGLRRLVAWHRGTAAATTAAST